MHSSRIKKRVFLAMCLLALPACAVASKEGILPLSSFRLELDGIGQSGKIIVEGKGDTDGHLLSLKVTAFGKQYVVPRDRLAQFRVTANGVRISYEAGYRETGGRTVYVQFQMGFTSGTQQEAIHRGVRNRACQV